MKKYRLFAVQSNGDRDLIATNNKLEQIESLLDLYLELGGEVSDIDGDIIASNIERWEIVLTTTETILSKMQ
jgi:hypothetical protein